jgi:aspartyl-tRNA(Asn)/glutamyl-tRNA(Gln) amidotransferase subunit B
LLNKHGVDPGESRVTPEHLADLIGMVADDSVSGAGAKQALEDAVQSGDDIAAIVDRLGLRQVSDTGALGAIVDEVVAEHADVVEQFRAGKESVIGFLVGQVMKRSGGSANPKLAQELLRERLAG